MTSKNLFFKLMREDLKRRIWALGLAFLSFFFGMPVAAAMGASSISQSYQRWVAEGATFYGGTVSPEMERYNRMTELAEQIVGIHNVFTVCIIMAAAVVLGLTGFMYLHSKKQVDFYNSLPVRRELLYAVKYIDGILMILFMYLLNLLFAVGVFLANGLPLSVFLTGSLTAFAVHMTGFLLIYGLTTIAVLLTGNFFVSILGGIVLHSLIPSLVLTVYVLMSLFFMTINYRGTDVLQRIAVNGSPFSYYISLVGDGMGLSFTRSLVEMHGGKISVESEVNKGSCFTFWIPKTEAEEGCSAEVIASECNDIRQKTVPVNSTSPYTVLVIDDEEEICNLLERHLMEEYRVYKASDGKEGLAVAEEVVPDVVICDLMMPVMDGHAFLTALRKNPKLNSCKVIILTAKGSADDYVQVIDEKADLYLPKTVSLKVIDKYIYDFVGGVEHETAGIGKTQDRHPLTRNEKAFLKECRQVIKDNIDNPDFNAEFLAGKLSLSHSSLYKKIRTLTGMSLIEFINDYKISVAVNLFNRGETNVETVCLKCGFRDVKNFRNLFRRKTGLLPKQYVDSLR